MKIYRIHFYSKFKCLKGDCPVPCCHGWQIPIDPVSYENYRKTGGKLGFKLALAMGGNRELPLFNAGARDCYFYTKEGLCDLQLQKGHDFLPGICRRFPRKLKNYGPFCEESLELACPAAALLFLDHHEEIHYEICEEEVSYPDTSTNDDTAYLGRLLTSRSLCIRFLKEADPTRLVENLFRLRAYAMALQDQCATGNADLDLVESSDYFDDADFSAPDLLFDLKTTDRLMCSGLYHKHFKNRLPLLYEVCSLYFKEYDSAPLNEGDKLLRENLESTLRVHPELLPILRDYFIYYLDTNFLAAYEDYSFSRMVGTGMIHVHFLLLFFSLYEKKYAQLEREDMAELISAYERHARHNDDLSDSFWEALQKLVQITHF